MYSPFSPSRAIISQAKQQYKAEFDKLLSEYRVVKEDLHTTKDSLTTKLDEATARILELETVLSVAKLEAEQRLKKIADGSEVLMQEIIALRTITLNPFANNGQFKQITADQSFALHVANIENKLQDLFILHSESSLLPQETAEMFTTINNLNNTIKFLKQKSSNRLKKLQSAFDALELSEKSLRFDLCEANVHIEQLQQDLAQSHNQYEALLTAQQQQQQQLQIRPPSAPSTPSREEENRRHEMTIKSLQMQVRLLQEECHHLRTTQQQQSQSSNDDIDDQSIAEQLKPQSLAEDLEKIQQLQDALNALAHEHQVSTEQLNTKHDEIKYEYENQIHSLQSELKITQEALHNEQRTHAKLSQQITDLTALNTRYAEANQKLEATFKLSSQDITQQLVTAQQLVVSLEANNELLTNEITELKTQLDTKTIKLKALLHRRNEHDRSLDDLRAENARLLQEQTQHFAAKQTEKELIIQQTLTIQRLNQRNIGHMNLAFRGYESRLQSFSDRIRALQSILSILKVKLHEKEQLIITLQQTVDQQLVSISQVNKQIDEKNKEIIRLKRVQESLQNDFQVSLIEQEQLLLQSKRINEDLQLQIKDLHSSISKLKQEKSSLQQDLDNFRREKLTKDGAVVTLECTVEELKEKLAHKTSKCDSYQGELRVSHDRIMQLTLEHDKLQLDLHSTKEQLMTTRFQCDNLQTQVKSGEETIVRNKIEKEEMLLQIHEKDLEIIAVQERCDQDRRVMQQRFDHLSEETQKLQEKIASKQSEVQRAQDEIRGLMLELKSSKQERQEMMNKEQQMIIKHRQELQQRVEQSDHKTLLLDQELQLQKAQSQQQIGTLQRYLESVKVEKVEVQRQLTDLQCQYSQLEEEMALVVNRFQEEMLSLHAHIAELNSS